MVTNTEIQNFEQVLNKGFRRILMLTNQAAKNQNFEELNKGFRRILMVTNPEMNTLGTKRPEMSTLKTKRTEMDFLRQKYSTSLAV